MAAGQLRLMTALDESLSVSGSSKGFVRLPYMRTRARLICRPDIEHLFVRPPYISIRPAAVYSRASRQAGGYSPHLWKEFPHDALYSYARISATPELVVLDGEWKRLWSGVWWREGISSTPNRERTDAEVILAAHPGWRLEVVTRPSEWVSLRPVPPRRDDHV
jgi:hypothetical protein